MCPKIQCDEESEKFCKISWEGPQVRQCMGHRNSLAPSAEVPYHQQACDLTLSVVPAWSSQSLDQRAPGPTCRGPPVTINCLLLCTHVSSPCFSRKGQSPSSASALVPWIVNLHGESLCSYSPCLKIIVCPIFQVDQLF
jgi:hypothetical protein